MERTPSNEKPSAPLKLRDVRRIFRLIGEIRELGGDPNQWRPLLVKELGRIVGAQMTVSAEVHFRRSKTPGMMHVVDIGWGGDAEGNVWTIHTERDDERPETYWLAQGPEEGGETKPVEAGDSKEDSATSAADDWGKAGELITVKPERQVYGGKSFILSQYPLPHAGAVDQLGLHRAFGDPAFTPSQHRLVHLFHVELGRLWRRDAIRRAKDPTSDLPPRLSQTLAELAAGCSEKQIAHKLQLSRHTIHNYVKALHQRFGVSSRGELLAKVGQDRTTAAPKLSMDAPRQISDGAGSL
jgi:DNA-binding CsgD family transcriptional regulator